MKRIIKSLVGLCIAAVFLWLILRNVDVDEVRKSFYQVDFIMLFLSLLVFLLGYACRIQRWRIMLLNDNSLISWRQCAGPLMSSVAANNVLPFRVGDVIRAFGFTERLNITVTTSLTTIVVERLLDMLMLLFALGMALLYFRVDSSALLGVGGTGLLISAIVILLLLLFPSIFKKIVLYICRSLDTILPKFSGKLLAIANNVFASLEYTSKNEVMIKLIFWSILAWFCEGMVFLIIALALPGITHEFAAWLAFPVGTLSTLIPSTPGYIGTFDYFSSQAMIILGNSVVAATTFAFIVHFILWLPPTIIGGIYLLFNPVVLKKSNGALKK